MKNKDKFHLGPNSMPVRKAFLGDCFGVVLTNRMEHDPHVRVMLVTGVSNKWFSIDCQGFGGGFSSAWLPELRELMALAHKWMKDCCSPDPNTRGWRFKELEDREQIEKEV